MQNSAQGTDVTYNQTEHMQNSVRGTYVTNNPTEHIENSAQNTSDKKATEHIKTVRETRT